MDCFFIEIEIIKANENHINTTFVLKQAVDKLKEANNFNL